MKADDANNFAPDPEDDIFAFLDNLVAEFDSAVFEAAAGANENESLHRLGIEWAEIQCDRTERWINNDGAIGWRVYVSYPYTDTSTGSLLAVLRDKLLNRGWTGVEVVLA